MKFCIVSDFFVHHYHGCGERRYYEIAGAGEDQWIQSSKTAAFVEKILARIHHDKIITFSNEQKNLLLNFYLVKKDRICVVYNSMDIKLIDFNKLLLRLCIEEVNYIEADYENMYSI